MPHWLIKAAVQRGISWLPRSHKWNELFQTRITRSIELTADRFEGRLGFCHQHFANFTAVRPGVRSGFNVVEIGTGWYPTVPLGLFLCGASAIWTYDIAPLLSPARLVRTMERFEEYARAGTLEKFLPGTLPDRLARLREWSRLAGSEPPETFLKRFQIEVRVQDASRTGLPENSVDLVVSTGVLEYIPRAVLVRMLAEFKRVGVPGAAMSHYLNLVDQYSYFDRSIGPLNFLKFSERQWKYFNSPLTWLNRLRISDYRELFADAGFELVRETNVSGTDRDLDSIRLAPEFRNYSRADLLVLTSWLAACSVSHPKSPARLESPAVQKK